jgi:thiamine biosynthesis lipoprotein
VPIHSATQVGAQHHQQMPVFKLHFKAMASPCEICLAANDAVAAQALAQLAINEVLRIEAKYSRYRPDSVLSGINAQAGLDWVACDDETLSLLDYAGSLFVVSGGLFDATSGVLRRIWNSQQTMLPTPEVLRQICALIDWTSVQRQGRQVRLPRAGMELDFGGFGKEYAADLAAGVLQAQGVQHGYVNLAGDIRVVGPRPEGQAWRIGIQDPQRPECLIASLDLTDGGVATSGDYARYLELASTRYGHILNPHSGQPVSFWRSASVMAATALEAGALATIAMLKQTQAPKFLQQQRVRYLLVDRAGVLQVNPPSDPCANVLA